MKRIPTYEELLAENAVLRGVNQSMVESNNALEKSNKTLEELNKRKDERIAYLERLLFGSKRDRRKCQPEGPTLFDDEFNRAMDQKAAAIAEATEEIKAEAQKRRAKAGKQPNRPSSYQYHGLEERVRVILPEGVDANEYDTIGKDVTRILHREPAKVWVEVVERPILRHKGDKDSLSPRIIQAPAPKAVIGGNHVGADMLAQIIIDKFVYHLPEYRQVKQYADMGVKLPHRQ